VGKELKKVRHNAEAEASMKTNEMTEHEDRTRGNTNGKGENRKWGRNEAKEVNC